MPKADKKSLGNDESFLLNIVHPLPETFTRHTHNGHATDTILDSHRIKQNTDYVVLNQEVYTTNRDSQYLQRPVAQSHATVSER